MKYALIIGNDEYIDSQLSRLKTPAEDARELAKVFRDKNIGEFEEVKSVINQSATDTRKMISGFLQNKSPNDLVLVYFSGHGVLDDFGRLYFAFKETEINFLNATSISSSFLTDEMSGCRSKRQILILDCCHSGAFAQGAKGGTQKAVTRSTFEGNGYGRVVLTASTSTQFALEGDVVLNKTDFSLFTHYLLEGLKTGEADTDNDGYISLDEWYEYTYSKVIGATSKQIPQKWTYQQQGELYIAKNSNLQKKLPPWLMQLLENPISNARVAAVAELFNILKSQDAEMVELALAKLEKLKQDNEFTVSVSAKDALNSYKQSFIQSPITDSRQQENIAGQETSIENAKSPSESIGEALKTENVGVLLNRITLANNMEFMSVPAGKFVMGSNRHSDEERPQHTVNISYNYWMGRFPITNTEYNQFKKKSFPKSKENHPVVYITWIDIQSYLTWLNEKYISEIPKDHIFRLPSEAEWEKAARGEKGLNYPWGNEFDKTKCNSKESGKEDTVPAGYYSPQGDSPYGCSEMVGNVWEWTCSLYQPYPFNIKNIIKKAPNNSILALRGGSSRSFHSLVNASTRKSSLTNQEWLDYGFRIVLAPSNLS